MPLGRLIEARRSNTSVHEVHDIVATGQGSIDVASGESLARVPRDPWLVSRGRDPEAGSRKGNDVVIVGQAATHCGTDGTSGSGHQDSLTIRMRSRQRVPRPSDFMTR